MVSPRKLMSFLSVFHKVLQAGLAVATSPVGGAVISAIPGAGGVFGTILQGVTLAEQLIPNDQPQTKKDVVQQITTAAHPEVDPKAISTSIDQLVALLNQLQQAQQAGATK